MLCSPTVLLAAFAEKHGLDIAEAMRRIETNPAFQYEFEKYQNKHYGSTLIRPKEFPKSEIYRVGPLKLKNVS